MKCSEKTLLVILSGSDSNGMLVVERSLLTNKGT
jgi:hypothetical protein